MASKEGLQAGEPGDLEACLDLLRKLEWFDVDRCPSCGGMHPKMSSQWHGRFRHAGDCELARLIGAERGNDFACDCQYTVENRRCADGPTYAGSPSIPRGV